VLKTACLIVCEQWKIYIDQKDKFKALDTWEFLAGAENCMLNSHPY